MFRRLAERNNSDLPRRFGMHYGHRHSLEKPKRNEALFGIVEPIIFVTVGGTFKDSRRVDKVEAVQLEIGLAFCFTPSEAHTLVYIHYDYTSTSESVGLTNQANRPRADGA